MRIGIVTLYYDNNNYGGILQAYALSHVLKDMGHDVKVVSYYNESPIRLALSNIKCYVKALKATSSKKYFKRIKVISAFKKTIPHTTLFFPKSIYKANRYFDCFVVGSDQVWNPSWLNGFTSLNFAQQDKLLISYAASIGKTNLTNSENEILKSIVSKIDCISIREKDNLLSLKKLTKKSIECVLDPTLLLNGDDWDAVSSPRLIEDKYLFCYFLRGYEEIKHTAIAYAQSRGLKIAIIPFPDAKSSLFGENEFADYIFCSASPADFLSLIKHSELVLTDSFHASVFSHIYKRGFFAISRKENEMKCRLKNLTAIFGTEDRYIDGYENCTLDYLNLIDERPFDMNIDNYNVEKEKSLAFLRGALDND